jgi:HlyD family secretion protein
MRWSRKRVAVVAAVLALAIGWWLFRAPAVVVEAAGVSRGSLRVTVDEEGETRVRNRFIVASPTKGRLLRIDLDEGDLVPAGKVVARVEPAPLDPRDEEAALARIAQGEAALAQAERDAKRAEALRKAGARSLEDVEQARLRRTQAEQELRAARSALLAQRGLGPEGEAGLDGCRGSEPCIGVRAPVAGSVLRVLQESERIVDAGTPLLEIGNPHEIELVVDVLSADAVRIPRDAEILVDDWGGDKPLQARVRLVEPSGFTKVSALGVEEQRVNVVGNFVDPPPSLGDGYRIEARIVVWEGKDVVKVPGSALVRRDDTWNAYVIERGRARLRPVTVGQRSSFEVEVRSGLAPGEFVVLHPSDRIADGVRVKVH